MSHVPHMNESCHTYEWEMSVATPYLRLSDRYIGLFWLGYRALLRIYRALLWIYRALLRVKDGSQRCDFFFLTHMSEKCRHTYEWVMSYIWMSHVIHMNESCHTYEWDMSDIRMSHVTHNHFARKNRVMSHIWTHHGECVNARSCHTHMNESCPAYKWVKNKSHVRMGHVTHMNHTRYTCPWGMSHIWMRHVTHMNESCHTYECVMSHIWMSLVTHINESCHTYEWDTSHIWMGHTTRMNESCRTYE